MPSKKELLKAYVDLKKSKGPSLKIHRDAFLKQAGISRSQLEKEFISWTLFKKEANELYIKTLTVKQQALLSEADKTFDPNITKEQVIEDLRKVQDDNWGKHITRNFYRHHGLYSDSTWSQFFGTFQEFRRQAGLELSRHQASVERSVARQASTDHYRAFFQKEVIPHFNKYIKKDKPSHLKTIMAMSDLHDKECCEFSLSVFIDQCRIKQPDVIVLNGDIYDLLEFSRYNVDIRHIDIKGRFDFVKERVFAPLRKHCPQSQIDLLAGNHEMRLLKLMADATPNIRVLLSDVMGLSFSDIFGLDEYQINWASKFDLGAYTKSDINNETKKNYRIYYNTFIFSHHPDKRLRSLSGSNGHHHRGLIDSYSFINEVRGTTKQLTWSQTPGMHSRDAEYLSDSCDWNTGFLEVLINIKKQEAIQKIHFTHDDWTVIDGYFYDRKEIML